MIDTQASLWKALARAISGQATSLEEFDEGELFKQAGLHGVDLLLNEQLQAGALNDVSEALKNDLKQSAYPQVAHDMVLNDATQKLLDLLASNQIPVLLLKGTPVAHLYYPKTYLRPRCDTDLFIDQDDLESTAQLLSEHDYVLTGLGKRKHSSKQFVAANESVQQNYLHFDIHWKLTNRVMFANALPFGECLESSQPVTGLGANAKTLSNTDLMIHACIHRIAHGRNTERNRLIWLYDIHLLWNGMDEAEREGFVEKALHKKIGALCADALEVCRELFEHGKSDVSMEGSSLLLANQSDDVQEQSRPPSAIPPADSRRGDVRCDVLQAAVGNELLERLRSLSGTEPSAKLIDASKLRWAWADMQALPGIADKVAFARELLFG